MEATIQKIAARALNEGRLYWCVTDQYGGPCNGGNPLERIDMPTLTTPGAWSPKIEHPKMCKSGYHVTTKPWTLHGALVHLVEVDRVHDQFNNKIVCASRRSLAIVDPGQCIDPLIYVAARRPYLSNACLPGVTLCRVSLRGANLSCADLRWADLRWANLQGADLQGAQLQGADLRWADLQGAQLQRADLQRADLQGVWLRRADLRCVRLQRADLRAANLRRADLRWARLQGADLRRTDLYGADLQWADLYGAAGVDRARQKA
jgi:uncharacterized protein YjbI with pentapeptide repeats